MDFKYALRRLARSPGFLVAACVSLALGIGANTAAFSVLYGVLIRSMPVKDPASLAVVGMRGTGLQYSMSYPAYTYLRDHAAGIDGLIAFRAQVLNVSAGGETERVSSMLVSGDYFDVLGVRMAMGSPIQPQDDEVPGSGGRRGLVGLVSHRYWQRQLNGNAAVLGSGIRVNGYPVTVIGVLPPDFHGTRIGSLPDVFLPMMFAPHVFTGPAWMTSPQNNWLRLIARTKTGANLAQTEAAMNVAFRRFNEDVVAPNITDDAARRRAVERRIGLEPGQSGLLEIQGNLKPTLFALMGLVCLVLLIACVNVANLMVARAERAHRQIAIAIALGATRLRFWRQSLIESAIIGAGGVGLGLVLAVWMRALLLHLLPARQEFDISMDVSVFGAAMAVGLVTTIVLAFVTERRAVHVAVIGALKGDDLAARLWLRKGLIVAQLALSMLVLVAASLFTRTLANVGAVDPGFDRERVLIASTATDGYTNERANAFYAGFLQRVRDLPGVTSAAFAGSEPMSVHTGWTVLARTNLGAPPVSGEVTP
jgi:predicted permease